MRAAAVDRMLPAWRWLDWKELRGIQQ